MSVSSSTNDAMDDLSVNRRNRAITSAPKAGSVWESRMKLDEVKGGIKSLIATHDNPNPNPNPNPQQSNSITSVNSPEIQVEKKVVPKQSPVGKRKTWKSEGSPVQIARQRSELSKNLDENLKESSPVAAIDGIKRSPVSSIRKTRSVKGDQKNGPVQLRKVKSESIENRDDGSIEIVKSRSEDQCDEKTITSNVPEINIKSDISVDDFADGEDDKEIEAVKQSVDVKEITLVEQNQKRISIDEKKNKKLENQIAIVKKQAPNPVNHAKIHPIPPKNKPDSGFTGIPRTNSKLQNFVDLIMWRDVSKSAFVFGIGTFAIISSSYTKDLNISFISVVSYLGLVYLAAIFLFRSLITRGSIDMDSTNQDYVVGEEEAIWLIKLLLPYVNEFLLKLRALFSGDPSTTMKLAVLLFILARCGSSITIWKMAKLGFIGVFTVPKVCSSYSSQLSAYGTFWIRRFRDAWESCSHKKAVGFALFTLVWNLSSVVARIWAVFMLFVAFKYYQNSMVREGWAQEEEHRTENGANIGGPRVGNRFTVTDVRKQKKIG